MKPVRLLSYLAALVSAHTALAYYGPSIGRFINRDPIEERGGNNLYAYVRNQPTNAVDYLGMDMIFGVRVGSTVSDPGHVLVGILAGNNVRVFDWHATGGSSDVSSGFGLADASVRNSLLRPAQPQTLQKFIAARPNYSFYRISTTNHEDVLALAKAYELRDLANASGDDTLYNIFRRTCVDAACEVLNAGDQKMPNISPLPSTIQRGADRVAGPEGSWIRIATPRSNPTSFLTPPRGSSSSGDSGTISSEVSESDVVKMEPFVVNGTRVTATEASTRTTFAEEMTNLTNILGRRPTQDEWWNRDLYGGMPGSMRDRLLRLSQRKTPEEVVEEEIKKIMESQAW